MFVQADEGLWAKCVDLAARLVFATEFWSALLGAFVAGAITLWQTGRERRLSRLQVVIEAYQSFFLKETKMWQRENDLEKATRDLRRPASGSGGDELTRLRRVRESALESFRSAHMEAVESLAHLNTLDLFAQGRAPLMHALTNEAHFHAVALDNGDAYDIEERRRRRSELLKALGGEVEMLAGMLPALPNASWLVRRRIARWHRRRERINERQRGVR